MLEYGSCFVLFCFCLLLLLLLLFFVVVFFFFWGGGALCLFVFVWFGCAFFPFSNFSVS